MLRKIFIVSILFILSLGYAPDSMAYSSRSKIYLGADYVYSDIKYKNDTVFEMDDPYEGVAATIGFSSYGIGLEAWYMFSDKVKNSQDYASELSAYGVDLVGEAPLTDNFSVIVSIGLAKYTFNITQPNGVDYDQSVNGPRLGIGLQYEILPHIALRSMFHYTTLNSGETDFYDGVGEISGGIRIIY